MVLNAGSKADDLKAVDDLPSNIQSNVKTSLKVAQINTMTLQVEEDAEW